MEGLPDWATQVPPIGAVGVFAMLVIHIWRISSSDRRDYQETLKSVRDQWATDKKTTQDRHDAELKECRDQRKREHTQNDKLREQLTAAREAQWKAEDAAARYRRRLEGDL